MSPIAAINVLAVITLTPGTVISRTHVGMAQRLAGDRAVQAATSASRKSTWRRHPASVSRSSAGNSSADSHRRPRTPNTSLTGGRPCKPPDQHRVDLVLRARARTHELVAPRQPPAHRARPLVGHPHRVQLTGGQQLGQRAGIQPVGLRARPADPGVMRTDHHHTRHVRLEDPRDLPRVARHLQRDDVGQSKTGRKQLKRRRRRPIRPAERTVPASAIATSQKSRCTSIPIALHHSSPPRARRCGSSGGQTTQTDSCSQHNRASRRGGH